MKLVTEMRACRGRADRFEIALDGLVAGVLASRDISDLGLRLDAAVAPELEARLSTQARRLAAFDAAIGMLARGSRSVFELRQRLAMQGREKSDIQWLAAKLQADGLLNDTAFAVQFARRRFARGASRTGVLSGLSRAGVARSICEEAVETVTAEDGWDERESCGRIAAKKLVTLRSLEPHVARRRLVGFLRRRGFNATSIREALETLER